MSQRNDLLKLPISLILLIHSCYFFPHYIPIDSFPLSNPFFLSFSSKVESILCSEDAGGQRVPDKCWLHPKQVNWVGFSDPRGRRGAKAGSCSSLLTSLWRIEGCPVLPCLADAQTENTLLSKKSFTKNEHCATFFCVPEKWLTKKKNGTSCPEMLLLEWNSGWDEVQSEEKAFFISVPIALSAELFWGFSGTPQQSLVIPHHSKERGAVLRQGRSSWKLKEISVPCLVCTVPIKKGIVGPLQCLTKTPQRKLVKVEPILTVGVMKWPSKVKYSVSSCLKLTGFALLPL